MNKISIIIPVLNEEQNILKTLNAILNNSYENDIEIIVIDGGSQDKTVEFVKKLGVKIYISPQKGRANQMNFGVSKAQGDILLFLHGDTIIPANFTKIIYKILKQPKTIAGAFLLKIDSHKKSLKLVEKFTNLRSQLFSLPYGDQGIFLKKSTFKDIDGFKNLAIMEDFDLIQRLKKQGKITIAPLAVNTSSRRWEKLGTFKTTLINHAR